MPFGIVLLPTEPINQNNIDGCNHELLRNESEMFYLNCSSNLNKSSTYIIKFNKSNFSVEGRLKLILGRKKTVPNANSLEEG